MKNKKLTQAQRVLKLLQERGHMGVLNYEFFKLSPPILRAGARIFELRRKGYRIKTIPVRRGIYKFVLEEEPVFKETPVIEGKITELGSQLMFA